MSVCVGMDVCMCDCVRLVKILIRRAQIVLVASFNCIHKQKQLILKSTTISSLALSVSLSLSLDPQEITVGYNSTAHLLFLLPLLFVTPKLFALVISFVEVMLHMWAHRKNSTNGNPDVYYRSPMHVVTRQFCEVCRHERLMGRVGKLQDVRMKQMQNYFRKVTRNIA